MRPDFFRVPDLYQQRIPARHGVNCNATGGAVGERPSRSSRPTLCFVVVQAVDAVLVTARHSFREGSVERSIELLSVSGA